MTKIGIFEDEPVLQMLWEDIADEAGFEITGVCATIGDCCGLADDGEMDVAILDVKLAGECSEGILQKLERRKIPVLVCTGLEPEDMPAAFTEHEVLMKPFPAQAAIRRIKRLEAELV